MWRHYLIAAARNLARNKFYSAIGTASLALGFAAALLILLFVLREFGYDRWLPDRDRIYRVSSSLILPGRAPQRLDEQQGMVGEWLRLNVPEAQAVRIYAEHHRLKHGNNTVGETIAWTDPEVFSVLPFLALAGDLRAALEKPDGLVLTRSKARKIFGRENVIGETLELDRGRTMTVTGVLEDFPPTQLFWQQIFARRPQPAGNDNGWYANYLRAKPGVSPQAIERRLGTFVLPVKDAAIELKLRAIPVADLYLSRDGAREALHAFSAIAALILLIAAINFINLMTARAARRGLEVGVRKASGAARTDLILQFMGEAQIYVLAGMALAVALVELVLPPLNAYLDVNIELDYLDPGTAGLMAALALGMGLLAGGYPALVLSAFRPAAVLKGIAQAGGSRALRSALVVLQFAILIVLALASTVVFRQTSYALEISLQSESDRILLIDTACTEAFRNEMAALHGVVAVTCAESAPLNNVQRIQNRETRNGSVGVNLCPIAADFFEFYGLRLLAGRPFPADRRAEVISDDAPGNSPIPAVINDTARKLLGFQSPQAAIGQRPFHGAQAGIRPTEIIGVVEDFPVTSIREEIKASIYVVMPDLFKIMSVKLHGAGIPQTLRAIDALWKQSGQPGSINRYFLDDAVQGMYVSVVRQGRIFTVFAGVAAFIACLGLLGLAAFTAEQRTREIGIRKAMGAQSTDVLRLLFRQFSKPILYANLIAWPAGYLLANRWLEGFAYRVDLAPWMFLAPSLAALAVAWFTVCAHALAVARTKPVAALRYE